VFCELEAEGLMTVMSIQGGAMALRANGAGSLSYVSGSGIVRAGWVDQGRRLE